MSKRWQEQVEGITALGDQWDKDNEREIDCFIRDGEGLIEKNLFKEVREAMRHLNDYMAERIEYLEEQDEQSRLPKVGRFA
jgi:hypothetical protein